MDDFVGNCNTQCCCVTGLSRRYPLYMRLTRAQHWIPVIAPSEHLWFRGQSPECMQDSALQTFFREKHSELCRKNTRKRYWDAQNPRSRTPIVSDMHKYAPSTEICIFIGNHPKYAFLCIICILHEHSISSYKDDMPRDSRFLLLHTISLNICYTLDLSSN